MSNINKVIIEAAKKTQQELIEVKRQRDELRHALGELYGAVSICNDCNDDVELPEYVKEELPKAHKAYNNATK